jgi:Fic family protein
MFSPNYTITNKLLDNIKEIERLKMELNGRRFSEPVLFKLQEDARALSAYSSTSIEGNPLPLTDVKQIIKNNPEHIRDSQREVLNYNRVLLSLAILIKNNEVDFSENFIKTIQAGVVDGLLKNPSDIGSFRNKPVFVNDPRVGQTIYWPPDHGDVENLMKELVSFVKENKGKLDPLILAGVFHKQFVIVHPFIDGNGRTGRLCTKVLLADLGLDTFELFSFENYYNCNVTNYFEKVGVKGSYYDIKDSVDFTDWLEYFTDGIIDELLRVKKHLESILTPETRLEEHDKKVIEYIKEHGFITDRDYGKITDRAKATRALDFKKLIELGFIKREGKGKNTYYILNF